MSRFLIASSHHPRTTIARAPLPSPRSPQYPHSLAALAQGTVKLTSPSGRVRFRCKSSPIEKTDKPTQTHISYHHPLTSITQRNHHVDTSPYDGLLCERRGLSASGPCWSLSGAVGGLHTLYASKRGIPVLIVDVLQHEPVCRGREGHRRRARKHAAI